MLPLKDGDSEKPFYLSVSCLCSWAVPSRINYIQVSSLVMLKLVFVSLSLSLVFSGKFTGGCGEGKLTLGRGCPIQ